MVMMVVMVVMMMVVVVLVVMMVVVVVMVIWRQFSNVLTPLGLETHLLLHQQEDRKGETG